MMGTLGFSYIGLICLLCLFIPNLLYGLRPPLDPVPVKENRVLLLLERSGQALCTVAALCFSNFNLRPFTPWSLWLAGTFFLFLLYLLCWLRYFTGGRRSRDFVRPLWFIPLPLAVLPVLAFFLLGVYGRVIWMMAASVILGVGHIGITLQHSKAIRAAG